MIHTRKVIFHALLLFVAVVPLWAQAPAANVFTLAPGDIIEATVGTAGRTKLVVTLTPAKCTELADLTGRNMGKQVMIVVCDRLRSQPFIRDRIAGPLLEIYVASNEDALSTVKCLLTSNVPFDQLHRWTDARGETHFSDQPPAPTPTPQPAPKVVPFDPNVFKPLWGSWQVSGATMNGRLNRDPALMEGKWKFDGSLLTMQSPQKGTVQFKLKIDTTTNPMAIYLLPAQPIEGGRGWMLFSREGDTLKLAFFDNLEGRPASFEPIAPDSKPELIVLSLTPAR